jgi:hypothetical protein
LDDLRLEIRKLKINKQDHFGENLQDYIENVAPGYKKVEGAQMVESIDKIWAPILLNIDAFPVLSRLLGSTLSVFHGTASVEGAVNVTRNVIGDRSHRLTIDNLEAKKIVKSAVSVAPTKCCYDFDVEDKAYHSNWKKAYSEYVKKRSKAAESDSDQENEEGNELEKSIASFLGRENKEGKRSKLKRSNEVKEDPKRKNDFIDDEVEVQVKKKSKAEKEVDPVKKGVKRDEEEVLVKKRDKEVLVKKRDKEGKEEVLVKKGKGLKGQQTLMSFWKK